MSSLLRTSKFIKLFTGISGNITLNSLRRSVLTNGDCNRRFNSVYRYLATQSIVQRRQNENSFERSLRRLDMDVRRSGRIARRDLEEVLEEFKLSRSASSSQSLLLIRCCGNLVPEEKPEMRTKLVEEVWKTIEALEIPMDISHFNALLRVYLENQYEFSPAQFLSNLETKGIEPNRVTYQRLIAHYCQKGDIEGATQILQHMKEKQLPVNEGVFNSLVMGHAQNGDMESAKGMLVVMEQAGLPPSAETYATLLCGFAKLGDAESIKKILQDCDVKQIDIIDRDYMDVLYVAVVNGHPELADELIGRMRRVAGYNQDAVNLILKLINDGKEDIAYKILLTMPRPIRTNGDEIPIGNFFLRQLVKAKRPIEKILFYCNELEKNALNDKAHLIALEACLAMSKLPAQAFVLIDQLKKNGFQPRALFFWPLLASLGQQGDIKGMMEVILKMFEMKIMPGAETLREYVIPYLIANQGKNLNSDSIISTLRGWGVSTASSANALVTVLINKMKLKEAADVARRHRARYSSVAMMRSLNVGLESTRDYESYTTILSQVVNGLNRVRSTATVEEDDLEEVDADVAQVEENIGVNTLQPRRIVGNFLLDLCTCLRTGRADILSSLLPALHSCGLGINNSHAEIIQERLGSELTPEITSILANLTAKELVPVDLAIDQEARPQLLESKDLENLVVAQEAKGNPTRGLKRQLLGAYCRSRNLEGAQKLLQELEADKEFVFTEGSYAQAMELFATSDMPDDALKYRQKLLDLNPDAAIEDFKVIKLVECLVKVNRIEDAHKVISEQPSDRKLESRSFGFNATCWRMLNILAEAGNVEELDKLFEALTKKNFTEPTNILMGPLVKVHLVRNDIEGAMKKFEWCSEVYGGTPFKNQLACKLIEAEDAVSLQRITDISSRVHGEVNSLYDLVFSFVECGRLKQARRILETPGLRNRPSRLNSVCRRYYEEGLVAPLEGLVEATKDLTHIDRSEIYLHLLYSYCKANDAEKALGLWMQMQDEDVQPSDDFLISLAKLLRKNDMKVPFVEPQPSATLSVSGQAITPLTGDRAQKKTEEAGGTSKSPSMQRFRQAIRIGDTESALQCKAKLEAEGKKMPVTELTLLVEQLVKNDRIGEATAITENYLSPEVRQSGRLISPRVLRFLLNRLANLGDIDSITNIGNLLSQDEKKLLSFDNRLCNAYIVSGKAEEYLKNLDKQIQTAKDEELEAIEETFPRGGAIGVLKNHPELSSLYEEVATKYAARKILSPINMLWAVYFSTEGKEAEASDIWKKYLHNHPRIMFQFVCQNARNNKDISIINRLLETIKDSPVTDGAKGNIYSSLIDIHVSSAQFDEGLQALNEALKEISLESINRRALHKLKQGVEIAGKSFPYTIPKYNASSSSSSSSDDEPDKKKA